MNRLLLLCTIGITFLFSKGTQAQRIQWASELVAFSSQYAEEDYAAIQALGVPNAFYHNTHNYMAWVPKSESSNLGEYIHVGFDDPMRIQQVAVAESLNAGAISRIWAITDGGKKHKIYENKSPKGILSGPRLFQHTFPKTDYYVAELKIELATKAVDGSNQIDAIAISDSRTPIKVKINEVKYASSIGKAENLGVNINSGYPERLPIISPDGKTLFFTRKQHPQNIGKENNDDIWVAYKKNNTWSKAINIAAPLNDEDHNFVVATNTVGDVLFLANDYNKRKEGVSTAEKKGRFWSKPNPLQIENHYNDSKYVSYYVNIDGDILLMSVQRREGYGQRDFYVSFKRGGNRWSEPKNMGKTINSVGSENSIFLAADGKTIYFSSNGHPNHGGYDMFMSRRLDDSWTRWSEPKNLGRQINSDLNEFNYTIPASGDYAYFSAGSMQDSDLFRIPLPEELQPEPVTLLTAKIIDAETGRAVKGKLKLQDFDDSKDKALKGEEDEYQLVLPYGEDVGLVAEKQGYFSVSENMELSKKALKELDGDGAKPKRTTNSASIDRLQLKLNRVKDEMASLDKERKRKRNTPTSYEQKPQQDDSELAYLKNKFNSISKDKPSNSTSSRQTDVATSDDPELERLKRKFNQHYNKKRTPSSTRSNRSIPKEEDDELAAMKRKFNKHYEKEEERVVEAPPKEDKMPVPSEDEFDFDAYQDQVRIDLANELTPKVKEELQDQLYTEVRRELEKDLDAELRQQLSPTVEADVRKRLLKELEEEVKRDLKKDYTAQVEEDLRYELEDEIEEDLRNHLEDQVEKDLKRELKEEVKEDLRREMEYAVRRELEKELRMEIQQKMKAQAQAEKENNTTVTTTQTQENPIEPEYQEVEKEILLIPIKVGQIIPMNNIFFDANESSLKTESETELQRVLGFLKDNSNLVVEVGGHTNGWCSHEFAHELSTDRSSVVRQYFIDKGIPENRIQNRGYGKTNPIATNDTRAGRKKNQRVELKILEIL